MFNIYAFRWDMCFHLTWLVMSSALSAMTWYMILLTYAFRWFGYMRSAVNQILFQSGWSFGPTVFCLIYYACANLIYLSFNIWMLQEHRINSSALRWFGLFLTSWPCSGLNWLWDGFSSNRVTGKVIILSDSWIRLTLHAILPTEGMQDACGAHLKQLVARYILLGD